MRKTPKLTALHPPPDYPAHPVLLSRRCIFARVMQYHTHSHVHIQANHNSNGDGGDAKDKRAVRRLLPRGGRSTGGDSRERERERLLQHARIHTIPAWTRIHTLYMETQGRWDMSPGMRTYSSVISLFYKIHLNRLSQDSQRQRMLQFFSVDSSHIGFLDLPLYFMCRCDFFLWTLF